MTALGRNSEKFKTVIPMEGKMTQTEMESAIRDNLRVHSDTPFAMRPRGSGFPLWSLI